MADAAKMGCSVDPEAQRPPLHHQYVVAVYSACRVTEKFHSSTCYWCYTDCGHNKIESISQAG